MVEEVGTRDVAGLGERLEAHEARIISQGEVLADAATNLAGEVACGVQGAGRDAPHGVEAVHAALHEDVEDARREHAAHAATLEHKVNARTRCPHRVLLGLLGLALAKDAQRHGASPSRSRPRIRGRCLCLYPFTLHNTAAILRRRRRPRPAQSSLLRSRGA